MTKKKSDPQKPIVDKDNAARDDYVLTRNPLLAAHRRIGEKLRESGSMELEDTVSPTRTPTYQAHFVAGKKQRKKPETI